MSDKNEGIIIILSSPSGAGKTTLVKKILLKNKFSVSISHTTRKPRKNEIDGSDYFFVSEEKFKNLILDKKFLEYANVFNNYYGSSKELVIEKLSKGQNIVFDIDWQGTQQIKRAKLKYKIITIFILPPSKDELFNRLLNREMGDEKIASERMKQFKTDVKHWTSYDYVVVNDNLDKCYNEITNFINLYMKSSTINVYNKNLIKKHVEKLLK